MRYPLPFRSPFLTHWLESDAGALPTHAAQGLPPEPAGGWPLVSVVVPSFQQARYLGRCLRSLLGQGYPALEVIVMDGGSTDGSRAVLEQYDGRLAHWQSAPDGGQSQAINRGFARARGEIFAYLNSDDFYLPTGAIHRAAAALAADPALDVVQGHAYLVDAFDTVFGFSTAIPWNARDFQHGHFGIPQCATFWRRRIYARTGGFNERTRTCMDGEFYLRAAQCGARFGVVDAVLAAFRLHAESISGSGRLQQEYARTQAALRSELTQPRMGLLQRLQRAGVVRATRLGAALRLHPQRILRDLPGPSPRPA